MESTNENSDSNSKENETPTEDIVSDEKVEAQEKSETEVKSDTASEKKIETEPEISAPPAKTKDRAKKLNNKMRDISIDKVVINIGVGEAGDKLIRAQKVIELVTHHKPIQTISRTTNRDLGIRKGMPIGCKVTLRRADALQFLKDAFWVKENRIPGYSFDLEGNFSFGIPDYTDFPNMRYDPEIGIFGMDISVKMKRFGYHISERKQKRRKIPTFSRISPKEVKQFVKSRFEVEVIE